MKIYNIDTSSSIPIYNLLNIKNRHDGTATYYINSLPYGKSFSSLDLYSIYRQKVDVHFQVFESYTDQDSVVYLNEKGEKVSILGPFTSGYAYSYNIQNTGMSYYKAQSHKQYSQHYLEIAGETVMSSSPYKPNKPKIVAEVFYYTPCGETFILEVIID